MFRWCQDMALCFVVVKDTCRRKALTPQCFVSLSVLAHLQDHSATDTSFNETLCDWTSVMKGYLICATKLSHCRLSTITVRIRSRTTYNSDFSGVVFRFSALKSRCPSNSIHSAVNAMTNFAQSSTVSVSKCSPSSVISCHTLGNGVGIM
jgi:hypothetical protein